MSGCIGAWGCGEELPLGGAEGHMFSGGGDPCGEGNGDGGAADVNAVAMGGGGAGFARFRGGTCVANPAVDSIPSIILSLL